LTTKQYRCAKIDVVLNCANYTYVNQVALCSMCRPGFYRDVVNNECKERKVISNCIAFEQDSDQCKECSADHVLWAEKTVCKKNPSGEVNCEKYDSTGLTCLECKPNSYLEDNTCKATSKIPFCAYYSTHNRCTQCINQEYQLQNSPNTFEGVEVLNYCFKKTISGCQIQMENQASC